MHWPPPTLCFLPSFLVSPLKLLMKTEWKTSLWCAAANLLSYWESYQKKSCDIRRVHPHNHIVIVVTLTKMMAISIQRQLLLHLQQPLSLHLSREKKPIFRAIFLPLLTVLLLFSNASNAQSPRGKKRKERRVNKHHIEKVGRSKKMMALNIS